MPSQLRILILEDQPMCTDILSACLLEDNVEANCDYFFLDIIGKQDLASAKQIRPEAPFIVFTGSVDEETAVECLKEGAADYVLKQRPTRLAPALLLAIAP